MKFIINENPKCYEPFLLKEYLSSFNFYKEYGYNVSYPTQTEFDKLIKQGKDNLICESSLDDIKTQFDKIVDIDEYTEIYKKFTPVLKRNNQILEENKELFNTLNKKINFKLFNDYKVNITKYGPGGSYYPDSGSISIKYKTKFNESTLIHELVHIGIEESIISKYNLNHATKEYIVDTFMLTYFKKYFINYKYQSINDNEVNNFIKNNLKVGFDFGILNDLLDNNL